MTRALPLLRVLVRVSVIEVMEGLGLGNGAPLCGLRG